jgi:glycosyltransferase involved in cell wall biosynthesis
MNSLVSILIPVYNAERWIEQTIESALAQTWPAKEIIVMDDGSTDGSLKIVRRFEGLLRWETGPNRGGNAARNRLLELSSGEWLQYLDADDFLLPSKVERQMEFARKRPNCDIICSPTIWEKMENGRLFSVKTQFPKVRDPWILLAHWYLPQTGGSLWKRSALKRVGGWRVGQPCCQEHELYYRMLEAGCLFEFFDECLAVYRDWDHGPRLTPMRHDEIVRQRLLILERIEICLRERVNLTPARCQALNDARHQIARKMWQRDQKSALGVVRQIGKSNPWFCPSEGPASPQLYRLAYRMLGFRWAQWLAKYKRTVDSILTECIV